MRPRHKAAENARDRLSERLLLTDASMRPRHKAAENLRTAEEAHQRRAASMRPRHKAAENGAVSWMRGGTLHGFNEAAA